MAGLDRTVYIVVLQCNDEHGGTVKIAVFEDEETAHTTAQQASQEDICECGYTPRAMVFAGSINSLRHQLPVPSLN